MKFRRSQILRLAFVLATAAFSGCIAPKPESVLAENDPESAQLLSADLRQRYRKMMPKVAWPKLQQIFESENTIWYNHQVIQPAYQDTIGHHSPNPAMSGPWGGRLNSQGARTILPAGRKLFSADGQRWAFPLAHTAGTDESPNNATINFLHLPEKASGGVWPIPYWIATGPNQVIEWRWQFPKGTIVGEILLLDSGNGEQLVYGVRTRERFLEGWAVNIFRPFTSAEHLAATMESRKPAWDKARLDRFLTSLRENTTLHQVTKNSDAMPGVFSQTGSVDRLPQFDDPDYVKQLLQTQVFTSVYQRTWKGDAHAPTASEPMSITSMNNFIGIISVDEQSCARCHQNSNQPIKHYVSSMSSYGNFWGMDQIFSFHILDQSRFRGTMDVENRAIRDEFFQAGIVKPQLPNQLPQTVYSNLPTPYEEVTTAVELPRGGK